MLTKEQWETVAEKCTSLFNGTRLRIDGYDVLLRLERFSAFKNVISVYVNEYIKGEDLTVGREPTEIGRRFYRPSKKFVYCREIRKKAKKALKSKYLWKRELYKGCDKFILSYLPYWTSFSALKKHLLKNNQDISLIEN